MLEKIDQKGSIKINKSSVDKMTRYAVENKSVSIQGSRSRSRDKGESSSWTDIEDNIEKRKEGGIHAIGEKKVLIAKVRNIVIIQPRK